MRIMVCHPGHAVSTVDVANGLAGALKKTDNDIWLFDYNIRLAFYRVAFEAWKERSPQNLVPPNAFMVCASEALIIEAIDFVPDIVVMISGVTLHRRAYDLLHSLKIPVVIILTESPYVDEIQADVLKNTHAIAATTNDKNSVTGLKEAAGIPIEYLPHSFDPAIHYKRNAADLSPKYKTNVFFYGTLWPERKALFSKISGIRDYFIGGVDPSFTRAAFEKINIIPNEEMTLYYSGTKIAINHNRTVIGIDPESLKETRHINSDAAYSLGPRPYEIAACGCFQLSDNSRKEMGEIFGDSIAIYKDADELNEKIKYYLTHEKERQEMAAEAHARVQNCTFDNRVNNILLPFLTRVLNDNSSN